MPRRETSGEIDDAAAAWTARIDRAPLSQDEQASLDAWLAADVRRLGAFARAQAVMAHTDRAGGLGPEADLAKFRPPATRRGLLRLGVGGALAASFALVGVQLAHQGATLSTRKGEVRLTPLPDGSSVTLNTASKLKVNFTDEARNIELLDGEALFEVAKDRRRPFLVKVGDTQVRAVGTVFTVRRLPSGAVKVLVREGVVEVTRGRVATPVRLAANAIALTPRPKTAGDIEVAEVAPDELTRELVWREGMLAFDGISLRTAVAEFARYSDVAIVVEDDALADETITGLFSANDPRGFARAAAASLEAHTETVNGEVRLFR